MSFMELDLLAKGVEGYTMENNDTLYIPLIHSRVPGDGNVGRYIDSLPRDRRVVFPTVVNAVLAGMLERRGFTLTHEWAEEVGEWVEMWERKADR